jgi:BMFP domain-containing protein YqiC
MQSENRFLDDLAKVASGALGTLQSAREEASSRIRDQFDRWLGSLDLVARDEFDAVAAMAKAAREENAVLGKRIVALEAALGIADRSAKTGSAKKATTKKPAAKKAASKKPAAKKAVKKGTAKKAPTRKPATKS